MIMRGWFLMVSIFEIARPVQFAQRGMNERKRERIFGKAISSFHEPTLLIDESRPSTRAKQRRREKRYQFQLRPESIISVRGILAHFDVRATLQRVSTSISVTIEKCWCARGYWPVAPIGPTLAYPLSGDSNRHAWIYDLIVASIRGPRRLYVLPLLLSSSIFIHFSSFLLRKTIPASRYFSWNLHARPPIHA